MTQHFDAWAKAGMPLGKMDQVQILLEVGGGVGSAEFPIASVTVFEPVAARALPIAPDPRPLRGAARRR